MEGDRNFWAALIGQGLRASLVRTTLGIQLSFRLLKSTSTHKSSGGLTLEIKRNTLFVLTIVVKARVVYAMLFYSFSWDIIALTIDTFCSIWFPWQFSAPVFYKNNRNHLIHSVAVELFVTDSSVFDVIFHNAFWNHFICQIYSIGFTIEFNRIKPVVQ